MHLPKVMNDAFSCVKAHAQNCKRASSYYAGRLWEAMPNSCHELAQKVNQCLLPQLDKLKSLFSRHKKQESPTQYPTNATFTTSRNRPIPIGEGDETSRANQIWLALTGGPGGDFLRVNAHFYNFPVTEAARQILLKRSLRLPIPTAETFHPVDSDIIKAFNSNPILKGYLLNAFQHQLRIYGFILQENVVSWREEVDRHTALDNLNFQEGLFAFGQIAQMLWSLQLLGCEREASAFKEMLNNLANEGDIRVSSEVLRIWNSQPPHN